MAKIDMLKEKADRLKRWFSFLLNVMLTIFIGESGIVFGYINKTIVLKHMAEGSLLLLILFIKVVIMLLINYKKMLAVEAELEEI